jgi:hypothetical protein
MLAEAAYNEFYDQQPQMFFEDLSHAYQMRWVRAMRVALGDWKRSTPGATVVRASPKRSVVDLGDDEAVHAQANGKASKKGPKGMGKKVTKAEAKERIAQLQAMNEADRALLSDKQRKDKPKSELKVIWRMEARGKRIRHYESLTN